MKLAEALNNRADLKKRLFQLKERLLRNSKVQEGEEPSENPEDLLIEVNSCLEELELLIKKSIKQIIALFMEIKLSLI